MIYYKKIIFDFPGQTCNRFWSYLDTVSWAVLNKKHIAILFWDSEIVNYDTLRKSKYVSFPFYIRALVRKYGIGWQKKLQQRLTTPRLMRLYRSRLGKRLGFVEGWQVRESNCYYPSVREEVNALFVPNIKIKVRVEALFSELRMIGKFVAGIHIRHGDYAEWLDGRFYWDFDVYACWMRRIIELYKNEDVCFYISTNDNVPDSLKNEFEIYRIENGTAADDLYALSLCNIILGPPSTFSKWASLVGKVPYHMMMTSNERLSSVESFSPMVSHSLQKNGNKVW